MVPRRRLKVAASLLAADQASLGAEASRMLRAGADWLHVDACDGHFAHTLALSPGSVAGLRKHLGPDAFLDIHLAATRPAELLASFAAAAGGGAATQLTFHLEAAAALVGPSASESSSAVHDPMPDPAVLGLISAARDAGFARVGLALSPGTPGSAALPYLPAVDTLHLMSVQPGFGGQSFLDSVLPKIRLARDAGFTGDVEVDGGIGPEEAGLCAAEGASVVVSGTYLLGHGDAALAVASLRRGGSVVGMADSEASASDETSAGPPSHCQDRLRTHVEVREGAIDVGEAAALAGGEGVGGIGLFVGTTRGTFEGKEVLRLQY